MASLVHNGLNQSLELGANWSLKQDIVLTEWRCFMDNSRPVNSHKEAIYEQKSIKLKLIFK